jgi:glycosyltransferase involved in cell wall biosynthesis
MIYYTFYNSNPTLIREAESLIERGDEVDVICIRRKKKERKFERIRNVNVYRIMDRSQKEKNPLSYLLAQLLFFTLTAFLVTKSHIREKYDVIHVTSPPDFIVFTTIIPKMLGAKIVLDIHDIVPEFYQRKFSVDESHLIVFFLKWVEKISAAFADHVFTVTEIWRNKLIMRSVAKHKCSVIMNSPDTNRFYRRHARKKVSENGFRLLYHGALKEHFGVETMVLAMKLISRKIPTVKLDIYGYGPLRERLEKLRKDMNLEKSININNAVSAEAIPKIIEQCDVGIVPTDDGVFANEALSVKSLEFVSMEVPIVISRTKISQYYYDEFTVTFFEAGNPDDLAKAVIGLYRNSEKRKEMIQNEKKFNIKHSWMYYKKVYHGVLDNLILKNEKKYILRE